MSRVYCWKGTQNLNIDISNNYLYEPAVLQISLIATYTSQFAVQCLSLVHVNKESIQFKPLCLKCLFSKGAKSSRHIARNIDSFSCSCVSCINKTSPNVYDHALADEFDSAENRIISYYFPKLQQFTQTLVTTFVQQSRQECVFMCSFICSVTMLHYNILFTVNSFEF